MRQINQLYGYAVGDRVLATLGTALVRFSRAEDLPARLDNDRFCLVIDNATARDAGAAAERLGNLLAHSPVQLAGDRQLQVTLRTGVAELADGDDAAALIGRAFEHMQMCALRRAS
jgi:diguanylate cyclase (GGDEF)-like protein